MDESFQATHPDLAAYLGAIDDALTYPETIRNLVEGLRGSDEQQRVAAVQRTTGPSLRPRSRSPLNASIVGRQTMDSMERTPGESDCVFYAKVWPRMKAILIDSCVLIAVFVVAALVGANLAGFGAVAFIVWLAFWLLYDPLMVARTGGTIGHHIQNLRVVSDRTGRPPSLAVAFIRNVVKGVLGFVSLLAMAGSSRQKAIHDWIAGTTVQARDVQFARLKSFTKVRRPGDAG